MDDAAPDFAEDVADPAVARAEWRLALLQELTEIGMSLARGLRDEAAGIAVGEKPSRDPAEVFAGLSRAVRLTIALHAKADQELRDLNAGVVREREEKRVQAAERAEEAAMKASNARERRAYSLVLDVADSEITDMDDFDALAEAMNERLQVDEAYEHCGEWPLREIVERLCKDLDLHPDWSHWTGQGWDETYNLNPFKQPSRWPLVWAYEPPAKASASGEPGNHRQLE